MKRCSPLLLILVLVGAIAASQAAAAPTPTTAGASASPFALLAGHDSEAEEAEEFELEEGDSDGEACELDDEFEFEEEAGEEEELEVELEDCGEEEGKKKDGSGVTAPSACRVQRAESSITTLPASDQVKLTVHYLTYSPSAVSVGLKLKDGKGSLALEHATAHLGHKGVLHLTTTVGDSVMERAAKAKEFDVSLRAPGTPGYCGNLLEQSLRSKHAVGSARVYTQPLVG